MRKNTQDKSSQYGAVKTNETGRMIKKTYDGFQQAPAVHAWGQEAEESVAGPTYAMLPRNHMRMPVGTAAAAARSRMGMVWSAVQENRVENMPYDL